MNLIILAICLLATIGSLGALILFVASKKFEVYEDPRIGDILAILPSANCGACGYPSCSGFAQACVAAGSLAALSCPVGGQDTMLEVAGVLGATVLSANPMVAVVRCAGDCLNRPRTNIYDGIANCRAASLLYGGDSDCSYGCLGLGDCVKVCSFGALSINPKTLLAEIDESKCTSCGVCVASCPKSLIEMRRKGPQSRRIYVSCMNKDRGVLARKACSVACISCSKCQKACPFEAITIEDNLAYIDDDKCRLCNKCVEVCPTSSIKAFNFPIKKVKLVKIEEI
ncbi:ferredoxin [Bacteroidales bacterium]|nr:ferredoxin [Bacteroidales bacterium]